MSVFGNYARYYDLLYRDKDYAGEAQFIHDLIQTHCPNAKTILELGCGTGSHGVLIAKNGYQLHGVDMSLEMLAKASDRLTQEPADLTSRLRFTQGDIRQVRLQQTFDVALSLFHVISYQTTNEDLLAAFATAQTHLQPGGIFIFDVWYGPAVLSDPPVVRIKRLEDDVIQVTRIAEPVLYPNQSCVDVNYQVFIRDRQTGQVEELSETHPMRYLFLPELKLMLSQVGLRVLEAKEWMSQRKPGVNTWGVYFVAQKDL